MDAQLIKSLKIKKAQLDRLRPFPKSALVRLKEQIVVEWTFNSNAIEGSTLTLKETALILNEGLTISGKPLREHLEAVNHKEAILLLDKLVQKKCDLSEQIICDIHRIILKGINAEEAGAYRQHRVRILGALHIPPNPVKVPQLMKELMGWYRQGKKERNPVNLAALFHHKFVHIHPFIDGNGRCARLIMNLILMRYGYPPTVVLRVDRRKYYRVLLEADQGQFENYLNFMGRAVERSLIVYLQALTPSTSRDFKKQGYISLAQASTGTPYSQEYLSLLARQGILPAVKFQRNWMTTHEAVQEYVKKHIPNN